MEKTICLTKDFIILSTQLSSAIEAFLDRYVPELSKSTFLIASRVWLQGLSLLYLPERMKLLMLSLSFSERNTLEHWNERLWKVI